MADAGHDIAAKHRGSPIEPGLCRFGIDIGLFVEIGRQVIEPQNAFEHHPRAGKVAELPQPQPAL